MRPFLHRLVFPVLLAMAAPVSAEVRLYVFDCGSLVLDEVTEFGLGNNETPVRELFVPCYLIEHPQGRLLWDAGLPINLAGRDLVEVEPGMQARYDAPLTNQLEVLGLSPQDIDLVAFSHMHFDHTGAANLFTSSHLLIQDTEYRAAFVDRNPVFVPELYLDLKDNERTLLCGDHDVFGDGSVTIIAAPGHTPGHQALLLRLEQTGPVLLSGDLYHFRASRRLRRVPVFNTSAEETLQSMDKVEALLEREGAALWIEHDKTFAGTLDLAPAFYR